MKKIYLDNNVIEQVFSGESIDFAINLRHQILKEGEKSIEMTPASFLEYYGASHDSIKKRFDIDFKKINEEVSEKSKSITKGRDIFKMTHDTCCDALKKIIGDKREFDTYLLEMINKKKTKIADKIEYSIQTNDHKKENLIKFHNEITDGYQSMLKELPMFYYFVLDIVIQFNFNGYVNNFKKRSDQFKHELSNSIILRAYELISKGLGISFVQAARNSFNVLKSMQSTKKDPILTFLHNNFQNLGMGNNYDKMDSEILLLSTLGNISGKKQGEKSIHCFTMDCYSDIKKRVERVTPFLVGLCNLIESHAIDRGKAPTNIDIVRINFGTIECLKYDDGVFERKQIKPEDYRSIELK